MAKYRKILAKKLAQIIAVRGITKLALSKKAKVDRVTLDSYLSGSVSAGLDKLEALATALGVSVPELLRDDADLMPISDVEAVLLARDYLKWVAKNEGFPWPPPIDFLARILK